MLGKAMWVVTMCTLAFAICGGRKGETSRAVLSKPSTNRRLLAKSLLLGASVHAASGFVQPDQSPYLAHLARGVRRPAEVRPLGWGINTLIDIDLLLKERAAAAEEMWKLLAAEEMWELLAAEEIWKLPPLQRADRNTESFKDNLAAAEEYYLNGGTADSEDWKRAQLEEMWQKFMVQSSEIFVAKIMEETEWEVLEDDTQWEVLEAKINRDFQQWQVEAKERYFRLSKFHNARWEGVVDETLRLPWWSC